MGQFVLLLFYLRESASSVDKVFVVFVRFRGSLASRRAGVRVFRGSSPSVFPCIHVWRRNLWNPFRVRSFDGIVTQGSPKTGNRWALL